MIVDAITMRGFTVHEATRVVLPPSGVVLVTGPNGAGKSSLAEAGSWGAWGKTLRGSEPWGEEPCEVVLIQKDGPTIERIRDGKTRLRWKGRPGGAIDDWHQFESMTKAHEALQRCLLPWEVWRRACVFATADAAHFTLATDAERKRTLELLFGLDALDRAWELCRAEARANEGVLADARQRHAALAASLAEADRARERLAAELDRLPGDAPDGDLLRRLVELEEDLAGLPAHPGPRPVDPAQVEATRHEAEARSLRQRLAQVQGGSCTACGQPVPVALSRAMAARLEAEEVASRRQGDAWRERAHEAARRDVEAHRRRGELEAEMRSLDGRVAAAKGVKAARSNLGRALAEAEIRCSDLATSQIGAAADVQSAESRAEMLERASKVLGVRGLRAQLLARSLSGLEGIANAWLGRLAGGRAMQLRLSATTEQASGKLVDAISLEVEGAGGGRGYRAASGGERRRIDLALTIALAEAAGAARGAEGSTLFFDEVADGLDEEGSAAAAGAFRSLAERRCVVVISHSSTLAGALSPDLHLRVEGGKVSNA